MQLRKRLHNELVDLRGNIRVFCRVRPLISEDGEGTQADVVVHPDRDDDGVVKVLTKGTWKVFDLDKVFGPKSTQIEVQGYMLIIPCAPLCWSSHVHLCAGHPMYTSVLIIPCTPLC